MSINEVRALENLNPIPDGDEHLRPLNLAPVGTELPPSAPVSKDKPSQSDEPTAPDLKLVKK
jgi:hypothetical protein